MTERFTAADGRTLTYDVRGAGATLVCHPGGPGFSSLYLGDLAGLGQHFRLVLFNPRGTDGSDRPADPRAYALADYVTDLEELRAHLGLAAMYLLGHSHGGLVAIAYAAAYPRRVDRLVLASTAARFGSEQEAAMAAAMEARAGERWYADATAALEAETAGDYSSDEELSRLALRELPLYFARFGEAEEGYLAMLATEVPNGDALRLFNAEIAPSLDLRADLARIDAPTLAIAGEDDFITGPVSARELGAAIPMAETVLLPETGHFIFVEAPDRFRAEVARFVLA